MARAAKKRPRAPAKKKAKAAGPKRPAARAPAPRRANGADRLREIEQLLYRQAELLDRRQWAEFIELFAADGRYWMPASPEQTTGDGVPSIFYEDRDLMRVRMKRVGHPHAWSQAVDWGTNHLVSNVMIEREDARTGEVVVRSRFHMMEFRRDATRHFAGSYIHHLRRTRDGWRIRLQRVDMVNAEGAYDYVLQVWV
jgi:benzoate/toluate 1,2-dioxygenase subunit beta